MKEKEMNSLCDRLSVTLEEVVGKQCIHLTEKIMHVLHTDVKHLNETDYTFLYMRAAALARITHNIPQISIEEKESIDTLVRNTRIN